METALKAILDPTMQRPFVLSVAGLDPSAGAGILADIKTFEQLKVYGLVVNTANTLQTDECFLSIKWSDTDFMLRSIEMLAARFEIAAVKIGILPSLETLCMVIEKIKDAWPAAALVWDPVLKSTTGHRFFRPTENRERWVSISSKLTLITPNLQEAGPLAVATGYVSKSGSPAEAAAYLADYCPVFLKGGHDTLRPGEDTLLWGKEVVKLQAEMTGHSSKHGSGCVLSAAITAKLALGASLLGACKEGKSYTEKFLLSTPTLLGTHVA